MDILLYLYVGCVDNICSSDHKPVFASFDVGVITQFTSSHGGSVLTADIKIVFEEISVEVRFVILIVIDWVCLKG